MTVFKNNVMQRHHRGALAMLLLPGCMLFIPSYAFAQLQVPVWDEALSGTFDGDFAWFKRSFGRDPYSPNSFREDFNETFDQGGLLEAPISLIETGLADFGGGWFYDAWMATFGPYGWFTQKEVGTKGYYEILGSGQTLIDSWDSIGFYQEKDLLSEVSRTITAFLLESRYSLEGGGGVAEPLFVTFTPDYMDAETDNTAGVFLGDQSLTNVCEPFTESVRIALAYQKNKEQITFNEKADCTNFNLETYYDSFLGGGGWDTWTDSFDPQNNFYGSLIIAESEFIERENITNAELTTELIGGQGGLDLQVCVEAITEDGFPCSAYPDDGCFCKTFVTRTHAKSVQQLFTPVQDANLEVRGDSDELTEDAVDAILSAIVPYERYDNFYEGFYQETINGLWRDGAQWYLP